MPQVKPKVKLLQYTPVPENLVSMAARLCYSQSDLEALEARVEQRDQTAFIKKVTGMGHLSVIEHAAFTFGIEGVSRSFLAQITRHRIASFSVQSQRYVAQGGEQGFDYVIPPAIEALGEEAVREFESQMQAMSGWYEAWRARLGKGEKSNEDARFVLPNACATRMMVTMNARELLHFLNLRCCGRAQWEIREAAWQMLDLAYKAAPALFENAGPGCLGGACPEGEKSCGRAGEMRERFERIKGLK